MRGKRQYKYVFDTKIEGIPAKIGVVWFSHIPGEFRMNSASDMDYYGYTEMEYDILDRKGYQAMWLTRKVKDFSALRSTIHNFLFN